MFTLPRLALALGTATLAVSATPAFAQPYGSPEWQQRERARDRAENRRERMEDRAERREAKRDWREWRRYNYNRYEPGYSGYYAENYYRSGYRPVRVTRNTRVYRGNDGRYYCRRNDGTTGLIVGAAVGGVIGNRIDRGESNVLGTLLGAGAGALLGREIDRGGVSCR